ncbi:hypothetical protein DVW12_09920 [Clostridium botulinum]|nr:hypothetical protein [Clostridium botulinum]
MNRKGIISTVGDTTVRVIFPELNDTVSYELKIASHINIINLHPKDEVLVCFYNSDLKSGVIIAELR